jgi:hypothetical protein
VEKSPEIRASADERERAVEALSEHVRAQRLSIGEFDERVAKANAAGSRGDLVGLFDDLPDPHPVFDDAGPSVPATRGDAEMTVVKRAGGAVTAVAYGLFPAAGAIALVLMIITGSWFWFLLVPPMAYAARELAKKSRRRPE